MTEEKETVNKGQYSRTQSENKINHNSANYQVAEGSQVSQTQADRCGKCEEGDIRRTTPKKSTTRQWQRQDSEHGDTMIEIQKTCL